MLVDIPGFGLACMWFRPGRPLPLHSHDADCPYPIVAGAIRRGTEEPEPGDSVFTPADTPYAYRPRRPSRSSDRPPRGCRAGGRERQEEEEEEEERRLPPDPAPSKSFQLWKTVAQAPRGSARAPERPPPAARS